MAKRWPIPLAILVGLIVADVVSHEAWVRLVVFVAVGAAVGEIKIAITRLDEAATGILRAVEDEFAGLAGVQVADAPERLAVTDGQLPTVAAVAEPGADVVPWSAASVLLSTRIAPPWLSRNCFTIHSPSPVPMFFLVVKKGWNIRS